MPEPPKPKASDPKVAKSPKDNPLNRLGPPPNYPAPPVPVHRDFHQTLGPPPQQPPRAATPRGQTAATAIPPPPSHPPPSAADLDQAERGRPRARAGTTPSARTVKGGNIDKSPAASAPAAPKPVSRSRSRVPATLIPRADGSFADQDTEVLRRARGGNLGTPSLSSPPTALRPTDTKYPPVVINSEGTWVRISKPPGATGREPATVPVAIPGAAASSVDAHELPDELWRDPSLLGSNTTLVTSHNTQVIPISEPEGLAVTSEPADGVEEEEATAPPPKRRAIGITTSSGRRQVYQSRRRSIPQPEPTSTAAAPGGPPSEPEAPDDPSEPGDAEGEEEEGF